MTNQGLHVRDLRIDYTGGERLRAVDGVSFSVAPGDSVGIAGESGCGKSTLARAIVRLLPRNGEIASGTVEWNGRDLAAMDERELASVRWSEISIVPQSSMSCMNPVHRVGDQIVEAIRAHTPRRGGLQRRTRRAAEHRRAVELCQIVGIDPSRLRSYPHELSGGMRQRMVLAMALALEPGLIIADEPTTGLDVIVQERILTRIAELQQEHGFAMILVTHDIGVIAETCRTVVVMYAGRIVEIGPGAAVLSEPGHPYTMGLKKAFPELRSREQLVSIPGHPPSLREMPSGCRFAARCPFATDRCREEDPQLTEAADGRAVACHYAADAPAMRARAERSETWRPEAVGGGAAA